MGNYQYDGITIKHCHKSHYSSDSDIINLLNYIAGIGKKKQKILHIGTYGLSEDPDIAASQIIAIQRLYKKNTKRRIYHIIVSFPANWKNSNMIIRLSDRIGEMIFENYQVFYAVHGSTKNLHIHFAFSATSYITGKKFHINREESISFKMKIQEIIRQIYL